MTSTIQPEDVARGTGARAGAFADERGERMPRGVRWAILCAVGGLLMGAAYLIAVRGEALLVDLAALGGRLWCF